ncbi:shieldin complex subunit 3 isoform 2-T2 [Menidia menidia]
MEHVVLHYRPGPAGGLSSLLETTEKLLEPFPCRPPPAFTPWFPPEASAGLRLPLRPARPSPVIPPTGAPPDSPPRPREAPGPLQTRQPGGQCSWSLFTQRGGPPPRLQPPSRSFADMVALHGLHLRQRAKWVIAQHNCRDVEKAWRSLSRCPRGSRLPTCHATLRRGRAEIWVFCDLLVSEQVGRFLKVQLGLTGSIRLSVHRLGDVFSL